MKYFKLLPLALVFAFVFACSSDTASSAPAAPQAPAAPKAAAAATYEKKAQVQPVKPTVGAGAVSQSPTQPIAPTPGAVVKAKEQTGVKKGGTLIWALEAPVKAIDPVWTTATVTWRSSQMVYDSLQRLDTKYQYQNNGFTSWEQSADGLKWTFNLRDNMKFHDGSKVTATDVQQSAFRWADRITAGIQMFKRSVEGNFSEKSLSVVDATTFTLNLKEPYPALSMGFSEAPFIVKASVAKGTDANSRMSQDGYDGSTYISSGPYVLKKWVPGYRFEYEPHQGWVGNVPEGESVWVDAVNVVEVPDKTTLLAGLKTGKIDYATSGASEQYTELAADPNMQMLVAAPGTPILLLNHTKSPFKYLNARRSIQAAQNAEKLMAVHGPKELWSVCHAIFLCGTPGESDAGKAKYNQNNLTLAQEYRDKFVAEAGWDLANDTIEMVSNTSYQSHRDRSLINIARIREIGFKINMTMTDWATAVTIRQNKDAWDIFHTGCCGVPSNNPVMNWYLSPKTYGWHTNQTIIDLQAQYTKETTDAGRKKVLDAVQESYYDQVSHISPGQSNVYHVWRASTNGAHDYAISTRITNTWMDK
jgi:peptide/nickel transport system substrate-binding protein